MSSPIRSFNRDFDAIVTLHGERPALIPVFEGQKAVSYEQVHALIDRHLVWMEGIGLQPGDRVGALMPNSTEMLVLFLACLRGGFHFAPLACDTSSVEAENWVKLVRPVRVIVGSILPGSVRAGLLAAGANTVEVLVNGEFTHLPSGPQTTRHAAGAKLYLFTSGTTGEPKAIVLDGDRLWSAGHAFVRHYGLSFDSGLRMWNHLPHSYLGGLFNLCLIPMTVAGSMVVDEAFSGKTFLSYWQTVDRYDLTALWLVPTIVRGLLSIGERTSRHEAKSYRDTIKVAFLGTAPIELETKRKFEKLFGIPLLENFALSETTFLTAESVQGRADRSEGSTGVTLPWAEIAFRSVEGDSDASYHEILVKTPFLFDGYLDAQNTISVGLAGEFFATGDLGYLDSKGQLVVTGRCKDIIKKGGQLVSLREIEVVVLAHPFVKNAAATVMPHPFYGESYRLFVQLAPSAPATALDDVRSFVHENLARYKWPDKIEPADEFPYTPSGKVRKFLLKGQSRA